MNLPRDLHLLNVRPTVLVVEDGATFAALEGRLKDAAMLAFLLECQVQYQTHDAIYAFDPRQIAGGFIKIDRAPQPAVNTEAQNDKD